MTGLTFQWLSTDPAISVTPAAQPGQAVVRAEQAAGSSVIVAQALEDPTVMSDPVLVSVARMAPSVALVEDDAIVFPQTQVRLFVGTTTATLGGAIEETDGGLTFGGFTGAELRDAMRFVGADGGTPQNWNEYWATGPGLPPDTDAGEPQYVEDPDAGPGEIPGVVVEEGCGECQSQFPLFVHRDNRVTDVPYPPMPSITSAVVLQGTAPAVGTVVMGRGLQPVGGRVVSTQQRGGYALVVLEPVEADDVYNEVNLAVDLIALRDQGLISNSYRRALLGLPMLGAFGECTLATNVQISDVQGSLNPTVSLDPVWRFNFLKTTGQPPTMNVRMGVETRLGIAPNLSFQAAPKIKFTCDGFPWGNHAVWSPPGWLGLTVGFYRTAPYPFGEISLEQDLGGVSLAGSLRVRKNVVVGFDANGGLFEPFSDFTQNVEMPTPFGCTLGGQACDNVTTAALPVRMTLGMDVGIKMDMGIAPIPLLGAIMASVGLNNFPQFKILTGKASARLTFAGLTPYAAARDPLALSKVTFGPYFSVDLNAKPVEDLLNKVGLSHPVRLSGTVPWPVLYGPVTQDVQVDRNSGFDARTPRFNRVNTNDKVVIATGDQVLVTGNVYENPGSFPHPAAYSELPFVMDRNVGGVAYVSEALAPFFGNTRRALLFEQPAPYRLEAAWVVPDGLCTVNNRPVARAVPMDMAVTWDPMYLPVGAGHGGTLNFQCQVVRGRVLDCDNNPVPNQDVVITGTCGARVSVRTAADGSYEIEGGKLSSQCSQVWVETVVLAETIQSEPTLYDPNAATVDLGNFVLDRIPTTVHGVVVNTAGPVDGALVKVGNNQMLTQPNGTFSFPNIRTQCQVVANAEKGEETGTSDSTPAVANGMTNVGTILITATRVYYLDLAGGGAGQLRARKMDGTADDAVLTLSTLEAPTGIGSLRMSRDGRYLAYTTLPVFDDDCVDLASGGSGWGRDNPAHTYVNACGSVLCIRAFTTGATVECTPAVPNVVYDDVGWSTLGRTLTYVRTTYSGPARTFSTVEMNYVRTPPVQAVVLEPIPSGPTVRTFTVASGEEHVSNVRISPDARYLAYVDEPFRSDSRALEGYYRLIVRSAASGGVVSVLTQPYHSNNGIGAALSGSDGVAWTPDNASVWFSLFYPDSPLLVSFAQGVLQDPQSIGPPCQQVDTHKTYVVCAARRMPEVYFPEPGGIFLDNAPSRTPFITNTQATAPCFAGYPPR